MIDRDVAIRLLRELAVAYKPGGTGPDVPDKNVLFQRGCHFPLKAVAKELGLSEVIL